MYDLSTKIWVLESLVCDRIHTKRIGLLLKRILIKVTAKSQRPIDPVKTDLL